MTRRGKVGWFAVGAVAAVVLGAISTLMLAGWPRGGSPTVAPWPSYSMDQALGPMGRDTESAGVDSELGYLANMIAHHQEAVAAARNLERSNRPEMRALGNSIVTTQSAEIARMSAWLGQWYPRSTPTIRYQPMMRDLSNLAGDALDERFLQDMIPHHMVAVMTSQRFLVRGHVQHQEVADLALTVRNTQHAEILQLRRYLAGWFGGDGLKPDGPGCAVDSAPRGAGASWGPGAMMGW